MKTRKSSQKAVLSELVNYLLLGGGMVVGTMGGKALDRMLGVDSSIPGFNARKLIKPVAQLGLGIAGSLKSKNPKLKMFSGGVGVSGVISSAGMLSGKNFLSGMSDSLGNTRDSMGNFFPGVRSFQPELPALHSPGGTLSDLSYATNPSVDPVEAGDFEIM